MMASFFASNWNHQKNSGQQSSFGPHSGSTSFSSLNPILSETIQELPEAGYLDPASRAAYQEPFQGSTYRTNHIESTRQLEGTFATLGSEQNPQNIQDFLSNKHQECHIALLDSEKSFRAEVQRHTAFDSADLEWEKFKENALMNYSATGGSGLWTAFRSRHESNELAKTSQISSGNYILGSEEVILYQVMREYNDDLINCRPRAKSLLKRCLAALGTSFDKSVLRLWQLLDSVIPNGARDNNRVHSSETATQYRNSEAFHEEFIRNARKYLEQLLWFHTANRVRNVAVDRSARDSGNSDIVVACCRHQLGISRVKAEPEGVKLHGLPIWALIYYSMRLGVLRSAIKFCTDGGEATQEYIRFFVEYEKNKGSLLPASELELRTSISGYSGDDMYKQLVLTILSRAEPDRDFAALTQTVEDWLWIKLAQVGESMTLATLQNMVKSRFPPGKTDDVEAYSAFVLTAQFERAVERLFLNLKYRSHSIHMALALEQLGLLRVVDPPENGIHLISEDGETPALNFISVIQIYANGFRRSDTKAAMEYFYRLNNTPPVRSSANGHEFANLFSFCVYKLAKDGIDLELLFGEFSRTAGSFIQKGLIHRFVQKPSDIVTAVAHDLVQDGRLEEGLALFEMIGDVEHLFRSLLLEVVDNITLSSTPQERKKLLKLATSYAERYRNRAGDESGVLLNFFVALDLMTFFSLCDQQNVSGALQVIDSIKVVPLHSKDVSVMLASYEDSLLPEVRECIPVTVLFTAQALVASYNVEKERIRNARLGTDMNFPLNAMTQKISGARLSDELMKVQTTYRKQLRTLLEFANKIASQQLPNLIDILVKLEATLC